MMCMRAEEIGSLAYTHTGLDEATDLENHCAEGSSNAPRSWCEVFFDEQNIVNTMQCLLIDTSKTIEDLSSLCVAMHSNDIVISLTHRGLMPIASAHMYIFPYAKMNKEQLCALRSVVSQTKQTFAAMFPQDEYVVHGLTQPKVESDLILFAATCLLLHGLSTTSSTKRGFVTTRLDKPTLVHHVNATLFHIIHACGMSTGAGYTVARLLRKHGVSTYA
jgi:hypothetical protein